jgi:hypothetical protein
MTPLKTLNKFKILLKLIILQMMFFVNYDVSANESFQCIYLSADRINKTTINFELPELYKFGTLIPIKITVNGKKSSVVSMNTVVIKDKPYVVLSDLYRIKSPRASIAIMMFDPRGTDLFMSYINMGFTPSAEFFIAKCDTDKGEYQ